MQNAENAVTPAVADGPPGPAPARGQRSQAARGAARSTGYLDSFSDRQKKDLAGVRDRLSILAESDTANGWTPPPLQTLDLHAAVVERAVVYFRLDADQRPLLAAMLAAAIVSDLISLVARLQDQPMPTVVAIDEFSAIAAEHVSRLFGRARSAGISLILGTQELADLKTRRRRGAARAGAREPRHADRPPPKRARIGRADQRDRRHQTRLDHHPANRQGTFAPGPSGRGSRRRGYEYEIHPSLIKRLPTGQAPSSPPAPANDPESPASTTPARHEQ